MRYAVTIRTNDVEDNHFYVMNFLVSQKSFLIPISWA